MYWKLLEHHAAGVGILFMLLIFMNEKEAPILCNVGGCSLFKPEDPVVG